MSFNNTFTPDVETGSTASVNYKDFPEFEELSRSIEATLHDINNNQLVSIRNTVREYESLRENGEEQATKYAEINRKYADANGKCTEAFRGLNEKTQELNVYLKNCENSHEDEDTMKYLRQKEAILVNLMRNSLRQFQGQQRKAKAFEKEFIDKVDVVGSGIKTGSVGQGQGLQGEQQDQVQVQITYEPVNAEELEQQSLMIEEREREIQQISQDTREINEIFLNLQDIIQEQQFSVDSIEDNILSYSADAQEASRELRRAERYQKRSGGRMLCCLFILIGVFGSVILIGVIF